MRYSYKWKSFFEYFFYKIAKINIKYTKPDRAIVSVSALQVSIVMNVIIFFQSLFYPQPKRHLSIYDLIIFLVLFFTIDFFNTKIYEGRYEELDKRWGNETQKGKTIGLVIVLFSIIFSLSLIFINGLIFGKFRKY